MKALGIDIGTTTISMVVTQVGGTRPEASRTVENNSFLHAGNTWERVQDPEQIRKVTVGLAESLLQEYPDITAIGITGQMHGIVYTDADGNAVSPLYTWQDGRGNLTEGREEKDILPEDDSGKKRLAPEKFGISLVDEIGQTCHIRVPSGYGLVTHIYNRRHDLVPDRTVSICTIGDYIAMAMTGAARPLMHSSNAASLGFFDVRRGRFDTEALGLMGMAQDLALLPEVTASLRVVGTFRGRMVASAIGDNQAGFLGAVGMEKDAVLVNMGTGGQISVLSEEFLDSPGIETRPFIDGKYLLVGSSLCGGRAYAILEKFFRSYARELTGEETAQYDVMGRLAQKGADLAETVAVETCFNGTRVQPDKRGSITGISEYNFTPEALIYGVLRGMAEELYELFLQIHEGTGITARRLIASGNGLRKNKVLRGIFSRRFQSQLSLAVCSEEAACGAAQSTAFVKGQGDTAR